jgi:hypothetical protein
MRLRSDSRIIIDSDEENVTVADEFYEVDSDPDKNFEEVK